MTPTGRQSSSEPAIQNLPGSFADTLSRAFERADFSAVWKRLFAKDFAPAPVAPKSDDPYAMGDYLSGLVTGRFRHDSPN